MKKTALEDEVKRLVRSALSYRAKESLMFGCIEETSPDEIPDKSGTIDAFFTFAQCEQQGEADALIKRENLNEEASRRYIHTSLKREYASENGTRLNEILSKRVL